MNKIYELLDLIGFERQTRTMFKLDDNYLFVIDQFSMTLMYRDNEGKWDDLYTMNSYKNFSDKSLDTFIKFLNNEFKNEIRNKLRKNKINELL